MHKYTCITPYFINIIIREHNGSVLMDAWYTSNSVTLRLLIVENVKLLKY